MVPFSWSSPDDGTQPIFKFAATARATGAAEMLRPVTDQALATLIDAALQQEIADLVRGVDPLIELALALRQAGGVRGSPPVFNRGLILTEPVIRSIAADRADGRPSTTIRAATVFFGPDLVTSFELTAVELEHGSLSTVVSVAVTGVLLPIVLAAAAPWAQSAYNDHLTSNEIKRTIDGTPCGVEFAAQFDLALMRSLAVTNLLKVHARSKQERRMRVCMLQTMLHLNGAYAGYVDGIEGPMTRAALEKFATASGLKSDQIDTVAFYDALISGIQPKR